MMAKVTFRQHLRCGGPRRSLFFNGMGGRVVEGSGLENRRTCKRSVGSNPTPSAIRFSYRIDLLTILTRFRPRREDRVFWFDWRKIFYGCRYGTPRPVHNFA